MWRTLVSVSLAAVLAGAVATPIPTAVGATVLAGPEPPYEGTVFLDPAIVTTHDPSAFESLSYAGRGIRRVYDRRVNDFVDIDAYLFDIVYDDGLLTEAVVNPEVGSVAAAEQAADRYGRAVGQLPHVLRVDVDQLWIHRGTELFGGGNRSILIHTGQAALYEFDGFLEEALVHEGAHTSLDESYYQEGSGWRQAQGADDAFISTYARDFPLREDVAETFVPYLAQRYHASRIDPDTERTIRTTVPHRLAFLDEEGLDMYPVTSEPNAAIEKDLDGWVRESHRTSGRAGTVRAKGKRLLIGDDRAGRELRSVLSFVCPERSGSAEVTGVTLRLTRTRQRGRAPRYLRVDMRRGSFGSPALTRRDFARRPTRSVRVRYRPGRGVLQVPLPVMSDVFRPGHRVQLRLRAAPVRDRNRRADLVTLASGEWFRSAPRLVLTYTTD